MDLESALVKEGWVSPNQFLRAKEEQKRNLRSIYTILIKSGFLNEESVCLFFSQHAGIPYVKLSDYIVDEKLVVMFPETLYREYLFFPFCMKNEVLYCAMANPLDAGVINILRMHTACDVQPLFAPITSLRKKIEDFFGPEDKYYDVDELIMPPQPLQEVPFWRESERCVLNVSVEIRPDDEAVRLITSSYVPASATDISSSGKALGVTSVIFLPPDTDILLRFPDKDPAYEAKGKIARCAMEEKGSYLMGVRFVEIREDILKQLLDDSRPAQGYVN